MNIRSVGNQLRKYISAPDDFKGSDLPSSSHTAEPKRRKLGDVSNSQLMAGSISAGVVLGTGLGALSNLADRADIPALDGPGFSVDTFTIGPPTDIAGWDIDIRPTLPPNSRVSFHSPNIGESMIVGGTIGAGMGVVAGVAAVALRGITNQGYSGMPPREVQGESKNLVAFGAGGAAVGATLGVLSHWNHPTISENRVIGQIPSGPGIFVPNDGISSPPFDTGQVADWMQSDIESLARDQGFRGVHSLVPKDVQVRVDQTGPSLTANIAGGAAAGAAAGVAGGILFNVLQKSL